LGWGLKTLLVCPDALLRSMPEKNFSHFKNLSISVKEASPSIEKFVAFPQYGQFVGNFWVFGIHEKLQLAQ